MTTGAQITLRTGVASAIAALLLASTAEAQQRQLVVQPQRTINTKLLRVARELPLPEHTIVFATGAEWHPGGNSIFFNGALTEPDFVTPILDFNNHDTLPMEAIAWSPDGERIVLHTGSTRSGSRDTLLIASLGSTPQSVEIPTGTFNVTGAEFSPRGTRLAVNAANGITMYDPATGREVQRFSPRSSGSPEDNGTVNASAPVFFDWSNDDAQLLVGFTQSTNNFRTSTVSILNGSTMQFIRSINIEEDATVARFHPSDNSRMLVAGVNLSIVNTATGTTMRRITIGRRIRSAEWRRDGSQIVTATEDNTWQVWDAATGTQVRSGGGREAVFSPNGNKLAVLNGTAQASAANTTITVQNAATGATTQTIQQSGELATKLEWRPGGTGILGHNGRRIHIWKVN